MPVTAESLTRHLESYISGIHYRLGVEFRGQPITPNEYQSSHILIDLSDWKLIVQYAINALRDCALSNGGQVVVLTDVSIQWSLLHGAWGITFTATQVPYEPSGIYDALLGSSFTSIFTIKTTTSQTPEHPQGHLPLPTSHACVSSS